MKFLTISEEFLLYTNEFCIQKFVVFMWVHCNSNSTVCIINLYLLIIKGISHFGVNNNNNNLCEYLEHTLFMKTMKHLHMQSFWRGNIDEDVSWAICVSTVCGPTHVWVMDHKSLSRSRIHVHFTYQPVVQ